MAENFAHGTANGYDYYKCRCDPCRKSHTARFSKWSNNNKKYLVKGISTHPRARHGLYTTYNNYHCRCYLCCKAISNRKETYNNV